MTQKKMRIENPPFLRSRLIKSVLNKATEINHKLPGTHRRQKGSSIQNRKSFIQRNINGNPSYPNRQHKQYLKLPLYKTWLRLANVTNLGAKTSQSGCSDQNCKCESKFTKNTRKLCGPGQNRFYSCNIRNPGGQGSKCKFIERYSLLLLANEFK